LRLSAWIGTAEAPKLHREFTALELEGIPPLASRTGSLGPQRTPSQNLIGEEKSRGYYMSEITYTDSLRSSGILGILADAWQSRLRVAVVCAETALVVVAFTAAVWIFEPSRGRSWARHAFGLLPYLLVICLGAFLYFGTYRSMLRHAGITDAIRIGEAVLASSLAFVAFSMAWRPYLDLPALFYLLESCFLVSLLFAMHFGFRVLRVQRALARRMGKRAIVVGAGYAGAAVAHELALDADSRVIPVALLDDDPVKHGAEICGVPVLGNIDKVKQVVRDKNADEILVCIPSASREQARAILMKCLDCQVPVRLLPTVAALADRRVSPRDLRALQIDDLLQRDEISYDAKVVSSVVGGKVVLVTGAGGTIGSELCRQVAAANPRLLLLLEKSENSLFYTHLEITERYPNAAVKPVLADIVQGDLIRKLFAEEKPQIVFHAAAHKHVGLLEMHPSEAIRNNVLGTRNVLLAAADSGVERFVNVSTDKAVNPSCFMGLSKKLTEMLTREFAQTKSRRFMSVRFGNVAGSSGSVLKLFWDQVQQGKPLRVTDPSATRYFMRVSEAVYLIFRAAALGRGGETFILEMGEPLNIYELARKVSLVSGFVPEEELPIEFVGLRKGEKLHEELWEDWENPRPTALGQILEISPTRKPEFSVLEEANRLETLLRSPGESALLESQLSRLVPSFSAKRQQQQQQNKTEPRFDAPLPFKGRDAKGLDAGNRSSLIVLNARKAEPA
jgi:FlaA1/EpsC-like NDP-sugar epimerase